MTRISALTALTSADSGDTLPILDVSATTTKKITKTAFLSDIVDGTLIAAQAITPTKVDLSVANDAARTALSSPFEGLQVYQADVDATYIYDGSAWRRQAQWEELGRTTLGSAGDTLACSSFAARKYLRVMWSITSTGGTINERPTFNGDSGSNYANMSFLNWATYANSVSQTFFPVVAAANVGEHTGFMEITNISAQRKLIHSQMWDDNGASAASSSNSMQSYGKWDNVSAQITTISFANAGTGDFAIGSELIVIGKN